MDLPRRLLVTLLVAVAPVFAGLPSEVFVTAPAKLEIIRDGKTGGSVGLRMGEKLEVLDIEDNFLMVRYRNLTGRVLAAHTDLPRPTAGAQAAEAAPPPAAPIVAEVPVVSKAPSPPPAPLPPKVNAPPSGPIHRALAGKLVSLAGTGLQRFDSARLAGVKFYGVYFSASWCGPCKQFTPELVDAYGKIRALYPEFEIVLMNGDRSPAAMAAYMKDDRMPWPALSFEAIRGSELNRYAGRGIPCLVLVDASGKVLSDSYRRGQYVGPDAVLDDTWKILKEYRKRNPRPKS